MIPLVSIGTGRELGWPEGLEPSTGGSTNRCSAIELWPPRSEREYSPKAAGRPWSRRAATRSDDAAGYPTSPDCTQPAVPTRDPTGLHGTWGPPATGPSHRGHTPIPNLPWPHHPNTPGHPRSTQFACLSPPVPSFASHPIRSGLAASPRRTALAIVLLFGISSVFTFAVPSATFAWDTNSFSSSSAADLVALTNRSRASAGLKALRVD